MFKPEPWLEITTVSRCVINCSYCPQKIFQQRYHGCEVLQFDKFKLALSSIPNNVPIHFSGFSEPFLNPKCIDMIEYAHQKGHQIVLFSTLVGLKSQDIERLKLCKVNLILHLPDHLGNAKIPTTKAHKEKIVKALETLHTSTLYVMDENFISNERAGLSKGATKRNTQGWFYCEKLFAPQFVMLPNCDLVLCCMDYALRHPVGNLLTQSWSEVIRSPEYERIKKDSYRLKGNTICRQCVWSSFEYRLTYSVKRLAQTYYAKKLIKKYANKKAKSKILS